MFHFSLDDRLSSWADLRLSLEKSPTPFEDVWGFWKGAPFVPYNHKVDPYNQRSWPSPWEIIVDNRYDDFTRALMIGWSLKLTKRFKENQIEVRTLVDNERKTGYNVVFVDDIMAINYSDNGPVSCKELPDSFLVENLVELKEPR